MSALSVTDDVVKAKDVRKRNVAVKIDAVVLASVMSRFQDVGYSPHHRETVTALRNVRTYSQGNWPSVDCIR